MTSYNSVKPDRFAWLLGNNFKTIQPPPDSSDFQDACNFGLAEWQALPVFANELLNWGGNGSASSYAAEKIRDRIISLNVLGNIQLQIFERIIRGFNLHGVPYALLKGSAVKFTAYNDPNKRMGKDFDFAIPSSYLHQARQIVQNCGFIAAQWDPTKKRFHPADPQLRARVEAQHYELGFLARRQIVKGLTKEEDDAIRRDIPSQFIWHITDEGDLACYITVDLHHGLSLEVEVEELVKNSKIVKWNGLDIKVPPPEWILFHLIYKIYWEGVHHYSKGAYQYADLTRIIPSITIPVFKRVLKLLDRFTLQVAGYYVLRRLKSDFNMKLAPEIEKFLGSTEQPPDNMEPRKLNDLGDMWPKIWGRR